MAFLRGKTELQPNCNRGLQSCRHDCFAVGHHQR
jgi:hypothetical protein